MLLVALTMQSFYRGIMTMEYQLHLPDYLAKCINKDRPKLHCNGQCVLMKKIAEKEKQDAEKNLVVYEANVLYIYNEATFFSDLVCIEETADPLFSPYVADYVFNYHTSIFHPPIA